MSNSRERSVSYQDHRDPCEDLDRQYHEIGIAAVVAALRYQGEVAATDQSKPPFPPVAGKAS
jgi:hypothetical protein